MSLGNTDTGTSQTVGGVQEDLLVLPTDGSTGALDPIDKDGDTPSQVPEALEERSGEAASADKEGGSPPWVTVDMERDEVKALLAVIEAESLPVSTAFQTLIYPRHPPTRSLPVSHHRYLPNAPFFGCYWLVLDARLAATLPSCSRWVFDCGVFGMQVQGSR